MLVSPPWFHHDFDSVNTESITLSGAEANHIIGARRLHVGEQLILSNGKGKLLHCVLEQADKREKIAILRVSLMAQVDPPAKTIVLASALAKGDRLSSMLDMATQIGITHFQPLEFERSASKWSEKLKVRSERIAIEAAKQSKRAWVPKIADCMPYVNWLEAQKDTQSTLFLADQHGLPLQSHQSTLESASNISLIVGPEGGLSEQELSLSQTHDIERIRLADAILRIETAVVAGLSAITANLI